MPVRTFTRDQWRTWWQDLQRTLRMQYWFPHVPLALLMALGGVWLLRADLGRDWQWYLARVIAGTLKMPPRQLPPILIGGGMLSMALALMWRSRTAWVMALLLVTTAAVSTRFAGHQPGYALLVYFLLVLGALAFSYRHFDRSSIAASSLFAFTSVAMLLTYATFGAYYLGAQYEPPITDIITALYYSMVTMSTVGYGDIVPKTSEAKLFTVSIIILGVAVFATSLTAVIAPMLSRSLQRMVARKERGMKREKHFVVIGDTPLATSTWRELMQRGRSVTRVLRKRPEDEGLLKDVDVVFGDPANTDTLREAGVEHAVAVMAMMEGDADNAFAILAARELGTARTVAVVNDARHQNRIKLAQPDVIIAPQLLGGELLAMSLTGEDITGDFVMSRFFRPTSATSTPGTPPASDEALTPR